MPTTIVHTHGSIIQEGALLANTYDITYRSTWQFLQSRGCLGTADRRPRGTTGFVGLLAAGVEHAPAKMKGGAYGSGRVGATLSLMRETQHEILQSIFRSLLDTKDHTAGTTIRSRSRVFGVFKNGNGVACWCSCAFRHTFGS